jgi:hypothetical protein
LKAAKRWKNKYHAQRFGKLGDFRKTASEFQKKTMRNPLASFMRLLDVDSQAPSDYAPGKTTMRINLVILGLSNRKNNNEFSNLSSVQKQKATKLLKHNYFDVMAMKSLTEKILAEDLSCFNAKNCYTSLII